MIRLTQFAAVFAVMIVIPGCEAPQAPPAEQPTAPYEAAVPVEAPAAAEADEPPPESAYRRFFLALLEPEEASIRPLILDHPNAKVLWGKGSYPPQVAELLAKQYREMEIQRSDATPESDPEKVVLNSTAFPLPMVVVKRDDGWKVDAGDLIKLRGLAVPQAQP